MNLTVLTLFLFVLFLFTTLWKRRLEIKQLDSLKFVSLVIVIAIQPLIQLLAYTFFSSIFNRSFLGTNLGALIVTFIIGLASLLILFSRSESARKSAVTPVTGILILFLTISISYGLTDNQNWSGAVAIVPLVIVLSLVTFTRKMLELSTLTALTIVVFTLSILMTRFDLVQNCRFDKCGFRAETLALGGTQNSFSIVIAGLSIVALLFTKRLNFFIIFSSFSLYLTSLGGSRTALIAQALCTTFLMFFKKEHLSLLKKISFIAIFLIVLLISALPVFLTFDRSFITGRGRLWEYAKESLGSNLILGNGPSFWTSLFSEAGFYANYGTHNIWLDSLVSFGLVGTFLFLLLILDIFKTSIFSPYGVLVLYVLLIGTTESSFQVWKFTHGTVLLFLFLFSLRVSKPKFESIQN